MPIPFYLCPLPQVLDILASLAFLDDDTALYFSVGTRCRRCPLSAHSFAVESAPPSHRSGEQDQAAVGGAFAVTFQDRPCDGCFRPPGAFALARAFGSPAQACKIGFRPRRSRNVLLPIALHVRPPRPAPGRRRPCARARDGDFFLSHISRNFRNLFSVQPRFLNSCACRSPGLPAARGNLSIARHFRSHSPAKPVPDQ